MVLKLADWRFQVDVEATLAHTTKNASDHCDCAYCRNYYEAADRCFPEIREFLGEFGVNFDGPSELMPFEPTLMLACYRIQGEILAWGKTPLSIGGIAVTPEAAEDGTFFLWIGEVALPWLQEEDMEEVISPANLPEFLDRMRSVWLLRHGDEFVFS